jgi:hypothetical protein
VRGLLVRQHNGSFSLLRYEPIIQEVAGTDHLDVYVAPGDPVGFRNMCVAGTHALLGTAPVGLDDTGDALAVEVFIVPKAAMSADLRRRILQAQLSYQPTTKEKTMYDIVINATLSGDSVLGVASVSKDGKPFTDYSATYHSMSADQIKMLNAHVQDFVRKNRLTGLTREQMQNVQKRFANHMFALGDKVGKGRK